MCALIMSATRMSVAIHRPTDVIVGTFVGMLVAYILHLSFHFSRKLRWVMDGLIRVEESICGFLGIESRRV